ncbi:MAG: hypothetical protein A3F72_04320 [Bacteroidetes bacterium RIFCSPLOWO2_12_FULL_35_15]|nr:MAG: hypothetical protein A3F72_04320 [Bacteroidetes bacterium RIFCSPLOWO2_12_FULL_35_15]
MKKNLLLILLSIIIISNSNAAVTFILPNLTGQNGTQITVPVKVKNFQNIISIQGTIQFDPAIVTYASVQQFGLSGMNSSSFGTTGVSGGKLTFSWYDASLVGVSVADSTTIFSITFNIIGSNTQVSALSFVNTPTLIEVVDNNYATLPTTLVDGSITVQNVSTEINNSPFLASRLEIFPNPNNGVFNINYTSDSGNNFTVNIINMIGEVVFTREYSKANFASLFAIDISNIINGVYQVEIKNENNILKSRVIINE